MTTMALEAVEGLTAQVLEYMRREGYTVDEQFRVIDAEDMVHTPRFDPAMLACYFGLRENWPEAERLEALGLTDLVDDLDIRSMTARPPRPVLRLARTDPEPDAVS